MEIPMSRVSLSLAVLIAIVCCADAMNYLAFPRMGRSNYLAFPRMGRSPEDHSVVKRDVGDGDGNVNEPTGPRRTRFPSNFFMPRKRMLQLASPEAADQYFELDKKNLPWNFIVPRKRGFPKGFFIPRKRSSVPNKTSGYMAFPRMGRSDGKTDSDVVPCCGVGLKEEFVVRQDGKEELRTVCAPNSECCAGLREIVDEKPDGLYYSMCIPDIPGGSRSQVLSKLLRK
ncbi:hypothetical protein RRG08_040902 [Elysia crispata]|uniref:Uncharacterized protein n=1 Tax=Elysia crispata TaxID=231223 RepID=A0AAE1DKP6_9GAST|nr:hypothetical protein RRG08_040902 [Elysia crispata]